VFFGSNFNNDTVSVKVNDVQIGKQYFVTSSKMVSRSNLRFRQTAKGIVILYNGKETIKPKLKHDKLIVLELIVNGKITKYQINLNNGPIILVDYSSQAENAYDKRKVTIEQHKDALITI
jgi:hypothetical protein